MPKLVLADSEILSRVIWSALAVLMIGLAFKGLKMLAEWMKNDDVADVGAGFSMADLRALQKQGKMSPEEFEKAKAVLVGTLKGPAKSTAKGASMGPAMGNSMSPAKETPKRTGEEPGGENSTVHPPNEPGGQ